MAVLTNNFLTHCMLGDFAFFLSSAEDAVRMQSSRVANGLDPDQT